MPDDDLYYIDGNGVTTIKIKCGYPAPIAVNGGMYAGCDLDKGHDDTQHSITLKWGEVK